MIFFYGRDEKRAEKNELFFEKGRIKSGLALNEIFIC
jgi:hypothetical protein